MSNDKIPDYRIYTQEPEEVEENKFLKKAKDNPFVPAGITGGLAALLYSAYKFSHRGETKLSVYLIHTRLAAQGAVVSALTVGVLCHMFKEFVLDKKDDGTKK